MKLSKLPSRILPLLLCLLLNPTFCFPAEQAAKASSKHSLWKVQGKTNAVYLFGSIHFLKKEFYPLDAPIEEAFKKSQTVVFETDIAELESPKNALKLMTLGQFPEGETLEKHLTKETYAKLQKKLKEASVPATLLEQLRPWMAAVTLVVFEIYKLGFEPSNGIDKYFHRQALEAKKKIEGLETVEFQTSLFADLAKEDQEAFLKQTLDDLDQFEKSFNDIIEGWQTGDAKKIEDLLLDPMRKYPAIFKKFLTDRNERWVPKIEDLLRSGQNVFVVVGAGHLVGTNGVVELLKKKGLTVRQL